ncbi:PspC domain-containing protein [Sporosarcina sp. HYO08]|uniref:PspC domain-containing protein n=1 Tax=Sporosarcina sp. HYO08 TaxID=1759557 RepID=UPI0007918064|nr:PspC domain-containing protein [Sporosarcina sp. HYO08]KXH86729.1 hypothetical protein AU377_14415 [Sporosarcina sp. HYO08]
MKLEISERNKLRKPSTDKAILGVCGGIAHSLGMSSFGVRLIFLILPVNLLIYIILANIMADSPPSLRD